MRGNRPPTKYEYQKDVNVLNSEFVIRNMFRNKRLCKTEGVKVNCSPPALKKAKKKKLRQGEGVDEGERAKDGEGGV